MAHFAEIKQSNNEIVRVLVFSNDDVNKHGGDLSVEAEQWVYNTTPASVEEPIYWKQTSYNGNFRKYFAGVGGTYDKTKDIFIHKKPYSSWTLNNNSDWISPIPDMKPPQPHPDWNWDLNYWNIVLGTGSWVAPQSFPKIVTYDGNKLYDIRWNKDSHNWYGIKDNNTFYDWNGTEWINSSLTEPKIRGIFYYISWDEDNIMWKAVDQFDDTKNYIWNTNTNTWNLI